MGNIRESLDKLMIVDGAIVVALADSSSGMMLGSSGTGIDIELACAGNTELIRAKLKTMKSLGLNDHIEDILMVLGKQYHIIRLLENKPDIFLYFVLDKSKSNLALARRCLLDVGSDIVF